MVLVFNDITTQYKMREALYESEQRLRQLAENLNEIFWLNSPDWSEVVYVSLAYEKKWELSAEELYKNSRKWLESVHPDDREQVISDIPKSIDDINKAVGFVKCTGGSIKVYSDIDKGSEFIFYFPRHIECNENIDKEKTDNEPGLIGDKSILIVDDGEVLREIFGDLLSGRGYKIFCAEDG